MENSIKKESFKFLIKEFHNESLPETIQRDLKIPFSSNSNKVIIIYGPRRSGKSFYFYTLIEKLIDQKIPKERILYLNFEDDRILPLNFKELNFLLEAYFELYPENKKEEIYLFFDEIQNIKNWEIFIRRAYDKERVRIFITGSSSKLLSREIATSLRGRTLSFALFPLSFKEFLRFRQEKLGKNFEYTSQRFKIKKFLEEYLEWGGFPETVLEKNVELKKRILREYFNFLVYRDLAERFSLENLEFLKEFLKHLLTNISALFSINSYFKATKQILPLSRETVSLYLSYIQETNYFYLLPKFSYSLKIQKLNPKKIISLDNGLRNVIAFRFSKDEGKLAENLVGSILQAQEKEIYYWQNKKECDFIIKEGVKLLPINVCYGERIDERQIVSLLEFKKQFKNTKKMILITKDIEKRERGIEFIPLWKWLLL